MVVVRTTVLAVAGAGLLVLAVLGLAGLWWALAAAGGFLLATAVLEERAGALEAGDGR